MLKKNIPLDEIIQAVSWLDIAWYLKEEVISLFKNLHYYKLENVYKNIDALKEYLDFLDVHSTKQINWLENKKSKDDNWVECDVLYYVSKRGLAIIGDDLIHQKIWDWCYNLSYIMQAIKWFLLLTADEFCNASQTRMSINRILWKEEFFVWKKTLSKKI